MNRTKNRTKNTLGSAPMSITLSLLAGLALATTARAAGEHGDMTIGSDADGGGNLLIEYPFDEVSVVPVSASGFPGLFTSTDPGFLPAVDEPLEGVYALDVPTTVGLEIVSIDDNVEVQLGLSTLSAAGDAAVIATHDNPDPELSSLHTHPQFLLSLATESTGEFAEGRFSFRVYDDDGGYGDSDVYTLQVSNGYLPPIEVPTPARLACRTTVAKAVRKLGADAYKRVSACFDAALREVALGTPAEAGAACGLNPVTSGSLASRLDAAHAKAFASAEKACGTLSDTSVPFTASAVSAHLGMASCRSQEVAGAAFGEVRAALEEVLAATGGDGTCNTGSCSGGVLAGAGCATNDDCSAEHAIDTALPCLETAAAHEE